MFLILLSLILVCFVVWVRVRWGRVKRYWADRDVAHVPPHPILGSLTFLQRENPSIFMKKMYQQFRSPYVGIWLFWRPALVVNSSEIGRNILVKDAENFRDRFLSSGSTDPVGALNIFTVNEPVWSSIRRRLTGAFTAAKLRALQGLTLRKSRDLVTRIKNDTKNSEPVNTRMRFTDFTTDVFGESAFGVTSESTLTGDGIMRKVTRDFSSFNVHRGLSWSSIFFLPELVDVFRLSLFPKDTVEELRYILRTIIEQRGGENRYIKDPQDVLDSLLKIKSEAAKEGEPMSEDMFLAQAAILLVGGFDTTSSALTWITLELAYQPELQERLYNELSHAKKKLNGNDFDPTTLSELPYLNAVIKEGLRKFPPMGWLDRKAARDYKVDDKLTIPAGTAVYVNGIGMHWDPDYYPEPEKFIPDRFLPENEVNIKPYMYMPFGDGPRNCIGMRFGYQTMRYGLSTMILNFEFSPTPTTPKPNDVIAEKKGFFLMPGEPVLLNFNTRADTRLQSNNL